MLKIWLEGSSGTTTGKGEKRGSRGGGLNLDAEDVQCEETCKLCVYHWLWMFCSVSINTAWPVNGIFQLMTINNYILDTSMKPAALVTLLNRSLTILVLYSENRIDRHQDTVQTWEHRHRGKNKTLSIKEKQKKMARIFYIWILF